MTKSFGYTVSEFVGFLHNNHADIPEHFDAREINAIRTLAQHHQEASALERVRALAEEFRQANLVDLIKSIANEALAHKLELPKTKQFVFDSSSEIRIHLFKKNPAAKILSIKKELVTIAALPLRRVPVLEPGYGYKGGAARLALAVALGENVATYAPRDLDLVRVGKNTSKKDVEIAQKYMPDDFQFGHSVEVVSDLKTYFDTRDLTMNQVVYMDGKIVCTKVALQDTVNNILRPTMHVVNSKGYLQGKIITKMLRLIAEGAVQGKRRTAVGIPKQQTVSPFDIALHLDRALQKSSRTAGLYISECIKKGYLTLEDSGQGIGDAIEHLREKAPGGLGHFEHLGDSKGSNRAVPLKLQAQRKQNPTRKSKDRQCRWSKRRKAS
ncbi:hypothetical protein OAO01_00190 [Oligoflexia bacterium]|nr:hypothetical protein [Oligoflexia bacterium]